MSADFSMPGVQSGCASFSSAATPAVSGADCDVPDMYWNVSPLSPFTTAGVCPARMSTPGAVTSGFEKLASASEGPRAEKSATMLPDPASVPKMPAASFTFTRSAGFTFLPASAASRSTSLWPSALPIMTAGMCTLPLVPFITIGPPAVL
jgi:hypothetical protein